MVTPKRTGMETQTFCVMVRVQLAPLPFVTQSTSGAPWQARLMLPTSAVGVSGDLHALGGGLIAAVHRTGIFRLVGQNGLMLIGFTDMQNDPPHFLDIVPDRSGTVYSMRQGLFRSAPSLSSRLSGQYGFGQAVLRRSIYRRCCKSVTFLFLKV